MPSIVDIYQRYKITRLLQLHQLRVAAVAKQICDNLSAPVDSQSVIKACLIHDMGNVLKFDFSVPSHFFDPEGLDYWQNVQKEVAQKYQTNDEHKATVMMARELGVNGKVIECIESISFDETVKTASGNNIEAKICNMADLRVTPGGIVSLDERLEEGHKRYKNRPDKWMTDEQRKFLTEASHKIEDNVFAICKIKPTDITDESSESIIEQLKSYAI